MRVAVNMRLDIARAFLNANKMSRIDELLKQIRPVAATLDPKPSCWICDYGTDYEFSDYCPECCDRIVEKHNFLGAKYGKWARAGDWENAPESDSPRRCKSCGCALGYSLSTFGITQELEHFEYFDMSEPLFAEDAYAIVAILEAAQCSGDAALIARAIAIGEAAVRAGRPSRRPIRES